MLLIVNDFVVLFTTFAYAIAVAHPCIGRHFV